MPSEGKPLSIYLDCNATTPIEPAVAEVVTHFLTQEFGNAASRTHEYGAMRRGRSSPLGRRWQQSSEQRGTKSSSRAEQLKATTSQFSGSPRTGGPREEPHRNNGRSSTRPCWSRWSILVSRLRSKPHKRQRLGAGSIPRSSASSSGRTRLLVSVMHANNETGRAPADRGHCQGPGWHRRLLARRCGPDVWQGTPDAARQADRPDQRQRSQDLWSQRHRSARGSPPRISNGFR